MKRIQLNNALYIFALFIIPILYFATGVFFQSELGNYYVGTVDPEFSYLFNGLNIAQGTLKVWHVDHPGTPLQILAAIVIRVVHLFHGKEPLLDDVLLNTQLYVKSIIITLFSLISVSLFVLGYQTNKYSKNIFSGLFLQLIPYSTYVTLALMFRINTEHMSILCVVLLMILLINYFNSPNNNATIFDKYFIWFSVITGFTIAVKITFLPLFFVPFFLFPGILKKIYYSVFAFLSFLVFILPVLIYRFGYFTDWILKLLNHSGRYGEGEEKVIDKSSYIDALKQTFTFAPFFTISFIVIILACIIYQFPFVKRSLKNVKYYNALLGVALAITLQILLIAKQFTYYYLTPALLVSIIGLYLVITIFLKQTNSSIKNLIYSSLILCVFYIDYRQVVEHHSENLQRKEANSKAYNFVQQNHTTKPLLLVPSYYGCPYQEYALYFGLYWGGEKMRNTYVTVLNKLYPNTIIYEGWDKNFHSWDGSAFSSLDVLKRDRGFRLYSTDTTVEKNIIAVCNKIKDTKIDTLFSNAITHETVYDITNDF